MFATVRLAGLLLALSLAACAAPAGNTNSAAVDASFAQLAALKGDWILAEDLGTLPKGTHVVSYRVVGGGSAVVETLFPGGPEEMVTVYHRDGNDLVLTHYCAAGNQPRMRATKLGGKTLEFEFDGGFNIDPSKDMHMHNGRLEFVSADEMRGSWFSWQDGGPAADHAVTFHVVRRKG